MFEFAANLVLRPATVGDASAIVKLGEARRQHMSLELIEWRSTLIVNDAYGSYAPYGGQCVSSSSALILQRRLTGRPIGFGRTTVAEVERCLRTEHSTILLAVEPNDAGTIRACVHCAMTPGGKVATLGLLAVAKTHQCRGVARALVQQAREHAAREWGATSLRVFVVMRQAALVAWYERLGFVRQRDTWRMPEEHRKKLFRPEDDAELFVYELQLCAY